MPRTLLPPGCYDLLPPHAQAETQATAMLLSCFESYGYEEVSPPLLEYTESLLAGRGAEFAAQVFRVLDPDAQKVMGIRADITLQVARIAASRLSAAPRPLRLSYAGNILRVHGESLREKRQFTQAGMELIGAQSPEADAEVITLAALALKAVGINAITVDLNMPAIVALLLAEDALDEEEMEKGLHAIAHKDASALKSIPFKHSILLIDLLSAVGPAQSAFEKIKSLAMPASTKALVDHMEKLLSLLEPLEKEGVTLTLDATESRAFQYHSGISFSVFTPGVAQELGRGGHYRIDHDEGSEPATGFTLYVDSLRGIIPPAAKKPAIYLIGGIAEPARAELLSKGYRLICALPGNADAKDTARKLGCAFLYEHGAITPFK